MFGVVPPHLRSLGINCIWLELVKKNFSSVSQSGWRVGGADKGEGSIGLGIFKGD